MFTRTLLQWTRSSVAKALALAFVFSLVFTGKTYAATDWSAIQSAMKVNGSLLPGNVLRFELDRKDLTVSVNGQVLNPFESQAANGFVAFKEIHDGWFFADGSLPAQESELPAVQAALRANSHIRITAIASRVIDESPKLIWVHFEADGNGADLAATIATALAVMQNPQSGISIIPGVNTVIDPASILPPNFLKLFDEGYVEVLENVFAFYLPRPDENRIFLGGLLGGVKAETGLGVGQSFYITISVTGGTTASMDIDFALRAEEVQAVEDTLRAGGFTVTSQSNWYDDEEPRLYFVHVTGSGDGFTLATTLYSVIQIIQADSRRFGDSF
ncbi:MAG: DUF1259 domain-containing protein [Terracidiphilus sp.]